MNHKRKKHYFKALLKKWRAYHDIEIDYNMMREEDWYRLVEIVKKEGSERLNIQNHENK